VLVTSRKVVTASSCRARVVAIIDGRRTLAGQPRAAALLGARAGWGGDHCDVPRGLCQRREEGYAALAIGASAGDQEADEGYEQGDDSAVREGDHGEEASGSKRRHRAPPMGSTLYGAILDCHIASGSPFQSSELLESSAATVPAVGDRNTRLDGLPLQQPAPWRLRDGASAVPKPPGSRGLAMSLIFRPVQITCLPCAKEFAC
jgi:hypothetical protein